MAVITICLNIYTTNHKFTIITYKRDPVRNDHILHNHISNKSITIQMNDIPGIGCL